MPANRLPRLAAILLLLSAPLAWSAPLYRVSATVTYADGPALRPVMLLDARRSASMSISGDAGYDWSVQLSDIDTERNYVTVQTDLRIADQHYQPSVRVVMGKPATVNIGEMHMQLLVEPHSQSQAQVD